MSLWACHVDKSQRNEPAVGSLFSWALRVGSGLVHAGYSQNLFGGSAALAAAEDLLLFVCLQFRLGPGQPGLARPIA
jgi:hypothetical protein